MLPRAQRLFRQEDIRAVVKNGHCLNSGGIRICVLNNDLGYARVALVVGKRVSAKAVTRHQLQRWLREVAREKLARDLADQSIDMVWVMRAGAQEITSINVVREMVDVLVEKFGWSEDE